MERNNKAPKRGKKGDGTRKRNSKRLETYPESPPLKKKEEKKKKEADVVQPRSDVARQPQPELAGQHRGKGKETGRSMKTSTLDER